MLTAFGFPTSAAGWAWLAANLIGSCSVLIVAYRHNLDGYRDTKGSARRWALLLASIWPVTLVSWIVLRRRDATPLSSHPV